MNYDCCDILPYFGKKKCQKCFILPCEMSLPLNYKIFIFYLKYVQDVQKICLTFYINGGAMGRPAKHWPSQISVWPSQFIGPPSLLAHQNF